MENKNLDSEFYIQSDLLKQVEPLMVEYFDYDSSMLIDKITQTVEPYYKFQDYISAGENGINDLEEFYDRDNLRFTDELYTHRNGINKASTYKDLCDEFPQYFQIEKDEYLLDHYDIYLVLSYMSYIYFRQKNDDFNINTNQFAQDADLIYGCILSQEIYPEILSLYRMILESKKKYKNQGDKITISYKTEKFKINKCGWFIDDMEKYFSERFPDLTLEKINELLPKSTNKGGRRRENPYTMIMIWGTYQLMKNHHSAFKNSNVKISMEMCRFILDYLEFCGIEHDFIDDHIKDNLKYMIKKGYRPRWNLPWRNAFSNIQDKQPESEFERLTQPSRRYNFIKNL